MKRSNIKKFTVDFSSRLDSFLAENIEATRTQIKRWIENGDVLVDKEIVKKPSKKVHENQKIIINIPGPIESELPSEKLPLNILYEDKDLIVINKSPGVIVHPAGKIRSGTLVNALLHHCKDLSGIGGELKPGIVHRLDRGTSGVMVIAKNDKSHLFLAKQFQNREVNKHYLALVYGSPDEEGEVESPIGRSIGDRKKFSSRTKKSRYAHTAWKVKEYFGDDLAFLQVQIFTGRTHQIRVHLTENGYPLVGDPLYGRRKERRKIKDEYRTAIKNFKRPALHAWKLELTHPNGENMKFTAPMPSDLKKLLAALRK